MTQERACVVQRHGSLRLGLCLSTAPRAPSSTLLVRYMHDDSGVDFRKLIQKSVTEGMNAFGLTVSEETLRMSEYQERQTEDCDESTETCDSSVDVCWLDFVAYVLGRFKTVGDLREALRAPTPRCAWEYV